MTMQAGDGQGNDGAGDGSTQPKAGESQKPQLCPRCGFEFEVYCSRCDAFEHDGEPSVRYPEDMEGT